MVLKEIAEMIKSWDNILVVCHKSPDGDAFGSSVALISALQSMGKKVGFKCADPVSKRYAFLFEGVTIDEIEPEKIITVDVADKKLLGSLQDELVGKIDLAIDHHASHENFAKIDYVEDTSASNAEIIYQLIKELGVDMNMTMATALYTGVSTDTGCFKYQNTTPRTHKIAAELMELGVDAAEINFHLLDQKSRQQVQTEILALSTMNYFYDDKIAMISVTREMIEELGIVDEDLDMLSSRPREIEDVLVGITLKEKEGGYFKASVRTNNGANASEICAALGGGGHPGAAGCEIHESELARAQQAIISAASNYLKKHGIEA